MNKLVISPKRAGKILGLVAILLCIASVSFWYFPRKLLFQSYNLDELFSVDNEQNIPTFFNSFLLMISALLVMSTARLKKGTSEGDFSHWIILGTGLFFMSLDEFASLHEKLIRVTNRLVHIQSDFMEYSWVIPGIILVVLLFIYFFPFIRKLPRKTRRLFLLAGLIYVLGAIGFEMLGSYAYNHYSFNSKEYVVVNTIEEFLEMAGLSLFIYSVLDYWRSYYQSFAIVFTGNKTTYDE